jgi:hypothetical protein
VTTGIRCDVCIQSYEKIATDLLTSPIKRSRVRIKLRLLSFIYDWSYLHYLELLFVLFTTFDFTVFDLLSYLRAFKSISLQIISVD